MGDTLSPERRAEDRQGCDGAWGQGSREGDRAGQASPGNGSFSLYVAQSLARGVGLPQRGSWDPSALPTAFRAPRRPPPLSAALGPASSVPTGLCLPCPLCSQAWAP